MVDEYFSDNMLDLDNFDFNFLNLPKTPQNCNFIAEGIEKAHEKSFNELN